MDLSVEGKSERIPPGSHICQLYSKVIEIPGVTARLMRVGLTLSEKCLFAAAPAQVNAFREGWQAVRISIDMTWLCKDIATPEQILKYEAASDAVFTFQNAPIIALMHYDHGKLIPSLVVEMLKLHPIAVVGKYIKRNPYYLNSEQYMLKILRINREKEKGIR